MCCDFAAGEPRQPATSAGKSSCIPSGMQEAPGRVPGEGDRPTPSPPGGDEGQEGAAAGLSHPRLVPLPSLWDRSGLVTARVPLSCTPSRGDAWQAPVPRQRGPKGDVYQNSEVGAVTSRSSFLWERKGTQCCVNKPPLPQAAPREGRGRPGWGSPILVPPARMEEIHFSEELS